jgi:hypothetical protein
LISLTLDIADRVHMERIVRKLRTLEGINQVERIKSLGRGKKEGSRGSRESSERDSARRDSAQSESPDDDAESGELRSGEARGPGSRTETG